MNISSGSAIVGVLIALQTVVTLATQGPRQAPRTPAMLAGGQSSQREFENGFALFRRVWTVDVGLGPLVNAQTCIACHGYPTAGGTVASADDFVLFSPEASDPSGAHTFERFEIFPNAGVIPRTLPRMVSSRRPPSLFGLGLLEAVPVKDGISPDGRARGRFGWKARFRTIDEAVAAEFVNELGLTSPPISHEGAPEISAETIRLVSQFVRLLPPPAPEASDSDGRHLFDTIGCAACHSPALRTASSALPPLRNRSIAPYTDLKLHDLGKGVSDGWKDGETGGSQFRTPALWGLHARGGPYLHDGRATTLAAAIEAHGGEADQARTAYRGLAAADQRRLLRFVNSL